MPLADLKEQCQVLQVDVVEVENRIAGLLWRREQAKGRFEVAWPLLGHRWPLGGNLDVIRELIKYAVFP